MQRISHMNGPTRTNTRTKLISHASRANAVQRPDGLGGTDRHGLAGEPPDYSASLIGSPARLPALVSTVAATPEAGSNPSRAERRDRIAAAILSAGGRSSSGYTDHVRYFCRATPILAYLQTTSRKGLPSFWWRGGTSHPWALVPRRRWQLAPTPQCGTLARARTVHRQRPDRPRDSFGWQTLWLHIELVAVLLGPVAVPCNTRHLPGRDSHMTRRRTTEHRPRPSADPARTPEGPEHGPGQRIRSTTRLAAERKPGVLQTPLVAIRSNCLGCAGSSNDVALCPVTSCPLWLHRFANRARAQQIVAEERTLGTVDGRHWAERLDAYTSQRCYRTEKRRLQNEGS